MLCLGLLAAPALAQALPARVVMLGNSYTQFNDLQLRVAEVLSSTVPGLGAAEGLRYTAGGLRLPNHVERVQGGDERWQDALTGEPGRWRWIVLQDQSQVPGFPESESTWIASAEAVTVLDGYAVAQGAQTVLFMTWGRRDGDATNPSMYPDFETMNARLDAGYRAYSERSAVDGRTIWMAPVGRAFGEVYDRLEAEGVTPEEEGTDFHRLYERDGSHPSPLGTALAAGVFARSLTGWTPQWGTASPDVDAADLVWLPGVVETSVEPFADLPYSWAMEMDDWSAPDDLDLIEGAQVISEAERCPTLRISGTDDGHPRWHLGANHGEVPGCGRLWLVAGAAVSTDVLSLAEDAGARGEVVVAGGTLSASTTTLGSDTGVGELIVSGGEADLGRVRMVQGRIRVTDGHLSLLGGSSGGALEMTGGLLTVVVNDGGVSLSEASVIAGALTVEGLEDAPVDVLEAPALTLADDLAVTLPESWTWELVDTDSGQALRMIPLSDDDEDGGGESGGESSASGDGDADGLAAEPDTESGDSGGGDASSKEASSGCGCAAASSSSVYSSGVAGLGMGLLAVARRRRR